MILNISDSTIGSKYGDNQENTLNGYISIYISSLGFWNLKSIPPKLFNIPSIESSGLMILFIFLDIVLGLNGIMGQVRSVVSDSQSVMTCSAVNIDIWDANENYMYCIHY